MAAVNIHVGIRSRFGHIDKLIQHIARDKGQGGNRWTWTSSGVTQGANINLPVPRKPRRVENGAIGGRLRRRLGTIKGHMLAARTVAFLASDAQHQGRFVEVVDGRGERFKGGGVALEAS